MVRWIAIFVYLFAAGVQAADRPNILFFLVDDMGTQDTSVPFYYDADGKAVVTEHNKLFRTPQMERLAQNGRTFIQAYAYSVCSPTRVSLVTGQSAPRHHVTNWTHPTTCKTTPGHAKSRDLESPVWNTKGVPDGVPLLPRLLKQAGYTTLFAGKAHFGPDDTPNGDPVNLGFDVNIAGFGGGGPGSYYGKYNYSAVHRNGGAMWDVPGLEAYHGTDTFLTEAITLEMKKAISKAVEKKQPFFSYMSQYAVHAPFLYPDKRFVQNYPNHKGHNLAFLTLVEGMDRSLGDLVAHLEALGVAEDTLIVFFSDNGSASPLGAAPPLRGMKGHRHEGGLRVPMIVSWAKPDPTNRFQKRLPIPQNSLESQLVTCLDMMPTILGIAGANVPAETVLDGDDISSLFTGTATLDRPATFLTHFPHQHNNTLFSTYRLGEWKIIYNYGPKSWELYHLESDIGEQNNLASKQPERALTLAKKMIDELDREGAQYPVNRETGAPVKPDITKL